MRITVVILSALLCLPLWAAQDEKSDEAMIAAAEQLINEGVTTQMVTAELKEQAEPTVAATTTTAKSEMEMKESDIPVMIAPKKAAKEESSILWRLVASVGLILTVAGALVFASKKWGRKADKGGQKARIEMMHQFHLGPKKSVALLRVSGEAFLIGITDQNINMLKSVTLIDDELEQALNPDFNGFLEDEFSVEDVRTALRARA